MTTSLSTPCILWRTTRTLKFHGMVMPRLRAGTIEAQISAPCHWMRVPVLPIPCAGTIELYLVAQRVIPLSTVAARGMLIVLEPVRRASAAAHPKGSTVRTQVLPRAEAQMMHLVASNPWRWQVSAGSCYPPFGARVVCAHGRVHVSTISVTWSCGSSLPPCGQIPIVAPAFLADDSLLGVVVGSEWM